MCPTTYHQSFSKLLDYSAITNLIDRPEKYKLIQYQKELKKRRPIDKPFILIYIIVHKRAYLTFFACTSKELMMNKKTIPIQTLISAKSQETRSFIKAKKILFGLNILDLTKSIQLDTFGETE